MAQANRKIVHIDQDKCNGCGQCATACAEGAIAMVNGKARLISEVYCDGLGACLGECPQGAITIEERPAESFDEQAVRQRLAKQKGAHAPSPARDAHVGGGCPGSALRTFTPDQPVAGGGESSPSALTHWPVQLMLVPPGAPFLKGADLLVCADCVPFAYPDFHRYYLNGRAVLVGCPKLDDLEHYRAKLQEIVATAQPASLTVLRMEVPCCAGIARALIEARDQWAPHMPLAVHTIGIRGDVRKELLPGG